MLFTWNTENLCIVFEGWHVNGTGSLIASLIGVILLTAGYELVRELSRRYEAATARKMESLPSKFSPIYTTQYSCTGAVGMERQLKS